MADPEKNPERRSDAALLCLMIGGGLIGLAYFLGIGAIAIALISGLNPVTAAGSLGVAIAAPLALVCGFILMVIGGVWILGRVIADSRGEAVADRYSRDVER